MFRTKISIIGAGNTGSTIAHLILLKKLGYVVIFDTKEDLAKNRATDLLSCNYIIEYSFNIKGTHKISDIENSDIVIITSGINKKPGMSREDLLEINGYIIKSIGKQIKQFCPNAFVICMTNPVNIMVNILQEYACIQDNKIIGLPDISAAAKLTTILALKFNIATKDINTFILGCDSCTLPLIKISNIGELTLAKLIKTDKIKRLDLLNIIKEISNNDIDILSNANYYTSASMIVEILEAYLFDKKQIFSCSVKLHQNQYDIKEIIFLTVPVKIGSHGIEEIIELVLTENEKIYFNYMILFVIKMKEIWNIIKNRSRL